MENLEFYFDNWDFLACYEKAKKVANLLSLEIVRELLASAYSISSDFTLSP